MPKFFNKIKKALLGDISSQKMGLEKILSKEVIDQCGGKEAMKERAINISAGGDAIIAGGNVIKAEGDLSQIKVKDSNTGNIFGQVRGNVTIQNIQGNSKDLEEKSKALEQALLNLKKQVNDLKKEKKEGSSSQHVQKILDRLTRNLEIQKEKASLYAPDVPPHIQIPIEELDKEIEKLKKQI